MNSKSIEIRGQILTLQPESCAYWEEEDILLIADIHIGKAQHFRNSGIPIPNGVAEQNLQVLENVLERIKPKRLLILGDLFHAQINIGWKSFMEFRKRYSFINFELIPGNHDILDEEIYARSNITIHPSKLIILPFVFSHEHLTKKHTHFNISGHVHPAILLRGNAGQRLRLPCFYFGKEKGLLPAFGAFTGMHVIKPKEKDSVFVIGEGKVININPNQ